MSVYFFITTLGCKVNQYESQALSESWQEQGWMPASDPGRADFILINTCAVTARAVAEARAVARRLRREAPKARIWLTGCAAEAAQAELADANTKEREKARGLPAETALHGTDGRSGILDPGGTGETGDASNYPETEGVERILGQSRKEELLRLPQALTDIACIREETPIADPARPSFPDFRISGYDRSRPVLKVQDGCSHRCTYCIVPLTRGPARSRPPEESLAEARRLLAAGFREITLSGINLRQYRHQETERATGNFWDLVEYLERELAPEWAGRARLRISSLEPGQLDERALNILGRSRLTAPHLHLSLQSGSPSVLKRMGRGHYDLTGIGSFIHALRKARPLFGLGADILTGFPGESETEFLETLDLCRSLPFSYAHVFPYSRRPGTTAAALPGQVAQQVKKERAALLRQAVQEKKQAFLQELLRLPVLHVVFEDRPETVVREEAKKPSDAGLLETPPNASEKDGLPRGQETPGSKQRAAPSRDALRGVCEFYSDCLLEGEEISVIPREITPVQPLRSARGLLVVRPVSETLETSQTADTAEELGKGNPA